MEDGHSCKNGPKQGSQMCKREQQQHHSVKTSSISLMELSTMVTLPSSDPEDSATAFIANK